MRSQKTKAFRGVPDLPENQGDLDRGVILDGNALEDAIAANEDFSGQAIHQLIVRRSVIEAVTFASACVQSARFRDVRFVRCDLSNAVMRGLEAHRVEFVDCRLMGLKAIECSMVDVLMERCDSRYAQFNDGAARSSEFIDTRLDEADFRGVNLENTRWTRSSLSRADLSGAKLNGADLRGASIGGMLVGALDVSGAIVTPDQAMDLARLLGLVIR